MSGHTPGPWELGEDIDLGSDAVSTFVKEMNGERNVGQVYRGDVAVGRHAAEANARLIVAAPLLLEAAIMLLNELSADAEPGDLMPKGYGALRAAVEKAEGGG